MMNVWVKTHHDGLIRAACIIRIENDGAALRVWHRAGGDAAVSSVKVCEVPDLNSKLPETFGEQLAAAIAIEADNLAVLEAVHGPSGWYWRTADYAHVDELRQARIANKPPKQPEPPEEDPLIKRRRERMAGGEVTFPWETMPEDT